MREEVADWERVDEAGSWRYTRVVLMVFLGTLAVFIFATQPGLQSGLVGIAGGAALLLETGMKLREALGNWVSRKKSP